MGAFAVRHVTRSVVRIAVVVLAVAAICVRPASALDPARALTQYQNDRWQAAQGLPQNTVQSIVQTSDGYLWVGTLDGLARFDGATFTVFNGRSHPELGSGSVTGLMEDRDGNLWIGCSSSAVVYKNGTFVTMFGDEVTAGRPVWAFAQSKDGAIWAATNNGLVRWARGTSRVFRTADGLPTNTLRSLTFDRAGTLWIGTTGVGLVSYDGTTFRVRHEGLDDRHREVRSVIADPEGGVWAATAGGGLVHVGGDDRVAVYTTANGLPSNQLTALARDTRGTLWIGTWGDGLCRFGGGRFSSLSTAGGLSAPHVWSLFSDREDSLWVGTWVGGLNRLRDRRFLVFGVPEGLSSDNVRSVLRARDGAMWVATAGGGVNRIDGEKVTAIRVKDGLPSDEASAVFEDRDGSIWIGTYTSGVSRWRGGRSDSFSVADGLPSNDVRVIIQDRRGSVWVGTMSGIARFNGRRFETVAAGAIPIASVVALREDHLGTLWIGSSGQGVVRLRDGESNVLTTKDGLVSNRVLAFHEDAQGAMWIGTSGGITLWRDGKAVSVRAADGLWDGIAQTILEDRSGVLWVTCNRGFYKVSRRDIEEFAAGRLRKVRSEGFGSSDALRSVTFAGGQSPSGAVDDRGRLWLPSFGGLVIVDPTSIPPGMSAPTVRLEEINLSGTTHVRSEPLVVPAGPSLVRIRYTAITLIDADRIRFRWRLTGLSPDWVDAERGREAVFPNLRHGTYQFQVAASVDGVTWGPPSIPLDVTIRPFFYQTPWFAVLVVIGIAGAVVGGLRWRLGWHRRRELELQERVNRALADVQTLQGLLPICAWCKKVRDDGGYWEQIEVYVRKHSSAKFSHGICPECMATFERDQLGPDGR